MSAEDVERCEAHLREREDAYLAALECEIAGARERVAVARVHRAKSARGLTAAELADGARVVVAQHDTAAHAGREYERMERARIEWLRAVSS